MSQATIPAVLNAARPAHHRTGAAAYAKAIHRYKFSTRTFSARQGKVLATHPDGSQHEVPAESIAHDLEYVAPVTIGTPGVKLMLDFDTGSSDLWVWSSDLKKQETVEGGSHALYDPKKSSTSKEVQGGTWRITYGDGSYASGVIHMDELRIGDLKCQEQGIEVATDLSPSFINNVGSDGLLGLAWPNINTAKPQQKTPMQNFIEKGIIPQGVFTCCLRHEKDGPGFYSFGRILAKEAGVKESDIIYTDVINKQGFWAFPSSKVKIGDHSVKVKNNTAIADTGTTLALVSEPVVAALYSMIPGAVLDNNSGGYVYPEDAQVPDVQIAVGHTMFTIRGKDIAYGPATKGMVFGGIQSRGNNPFDILGDIFLKSVYVVFDQKNVRIGVAQRTSP